MACQNNGLSLCFERSDLLMKRKSALHIKPCSRLVEKNNIWIADQRKGEMQPPFLPCRKLGILLFFHFPDTESMKHRAVDLCSIPFCKQLYRLHMSDMGGQRGGLQLDPCFPVYEDRTAALMYAAAQSGRLVDLSYGFYVVTSAPA